MRYAPATMRRRTVVAAAALIAAFALAGLPVPAGSRTPSATRALEQAAVTTVPIPANAAVLGATGVSDAAQRSTSYVDADAVFLEPGAAPDGPTSRPRVDQPSVTSGSQWKPPKSKTSGYATFYDNGTTAMRLPGRDPRPDLRQGRLHRAHRERLRAAEAEPCRRPLPARLLPGLRLPVVVGHHLGHGLDLLAVAGPPARRADDDGRAAPVALDWARFPRRSREAG